MGSESTERGERENTEGYEPPVVEDLDMAHGAVATAAGAAPIGSGGSVAVFAAPRELS